MITKLIENGNSFKNNFTDEYNYGTEFGISSDCEADYIQWISSVGVFAEGKLRGVYPDMTKEIIEIVRRRSLMAKDYNIIIGYLNSVNELGF